MTSFGLRIRCITGCAVAATLASFPGASTALQESSAPRCAVVDAAPADAGGDRSGPGLPEIYALFDAWREAVRLGDVEGVVELVTEDAEFWTQGAEPIKGRAALADAFRPFFANYEVLQDFECHELIVRGDLAVARGLERNHLTPRAGGDTVEVRQRAFSVMRRTADGRWRFARGMTNQPPER